MKLSDNQFDALAIIKRSEDIGTIAWIGARPLTERTAKSLERRHLIDVCPHPRGWATPYAVLTELGRQYVEGIR